MFLIAAGAIGTGLLVRKAVKAMHGGDGDEDDAPLRPDPPRPPVTLPTAQSQMPANPATEAHGQNWWNGNSKRYVPSVEQWRGTFMQQAPDYPIVFLLNYLDKESKGLACATGFKGEKHRDGFYKFEAGIGQNYFQAPTREALDHVRVHGVSLAELRAPCEGQKQIRPLTDDEKQKNAHAFLEDVRAFRATAHQQLAAAGIDWPESGDDFWKLVKLQHGLPCVPKSFLTAAAQAGHAATFADFRAFVNALPHDRYTALTKEGRCWPAMEKFFGAGTATALANANEVGTGVHGHA